MNVNDPESLKKTTCALSIAKPRVCLRRRAVFRNSGWLYAGGGERPADYGRYLGTAFQLIDDLLDYKPMANS